MPQVLTMINAGTKTPIPAVIFTVNPSIFICATQANPTLSGVSVPLLSRIERQHLFADQLHPGCLLAGNRRRYFGSFLVEEDYARCRPTNQGIIESI